jgi:hypothetical protein
VGSCRVREIGGAPTDRVLKPYPDGVESSLL